LELSVRDIERAIGDARERLGQLVQAVGIDLAPGSPARRLVAAPAAAPAAARDSLAGHELRATVVTQVVTQVQARTVADDKTLVLAAPAPATPEPPREQAVEMLAAGIQDVTTTLVSDGFRLNEVLRMILETMFRALGFRRVVFCLRDPKTGTLTGRFGLGEGAREVAAAFKVPLKTGSPDLFTAVCIKGVDTQIADSLGQPGRAHAAVVPADGECTVVPAAAAGDEERDLRADLCRLRPGPCHQPGGAGAVAAAHLAQPGGDGVQAGGRRMMRRITSRARSSACMAASSGERHRPAWGY